MGWLSPQLSKGCARKPPLGYKTLLGKMNCTVIWNKGNQANRWLGKSHWYYKSHLQQRISVCKSVKTQKVEVHGAEGTGRFCHWSQKVVFPGMKGEKSFNSPSSLYCKTSTLALETDFLKRYPILCLGHKIKTLGFETCAIWKGRYSQFP